MAASACLLAQAPLEGPWNVAFGRQVTVESRHSEAYSGSNLVDGDSRSRESSWFSGTGPVPHRIEFDLGEEFYILGVKLHKWRGIEVTDYNIEAGQGLEWVGLAKIRNQRWNVLHTFEPVVTRRLGIEITGLEGSGSMARLYEVEVLGLNAYSGYERSFWRAFPLNPVTGARATALGDLDDRYFPWVFHYPSGAWHYLVPSLSTISSVFGYDTGNKFWFWTSQDFGGWYFNYQDISWAEWDWKGAEVSFEPAPIHDWSFYDPHFQENRERIEVTNAKELEIALRDASAGDDIVLLPGSYSGDLVVYADGTRSHPIRIIGTGAFSARVIASQLTINGDYTIIQGLHFEGRGTTRSGIEINGDYNSIVANKFTGNRGKTHNPAVSVEGGNRNWIAFNDLALEEARGIVIDFEPPDGVENIIEYNYLHDCPWTGAQVNGTEGIQVGAWGGDGPNLYSNTLVNSNFLNDWSCEDEPIGVKGNGITIRGNTLRCKGEISLRTGSGNTVEHNVILDHPAGSKGIVVMGDENVVVGNRIEGKILRFDSGSSVMDNFVFGQPDVPAARRAEVEANQFSGNGYILVGDTWDQPIRHSASLTFYGEPGARVETRNNPTITYEAARGAFSRARELNEEDVGPDALANFL